MKINTAEFVTSAVGKSGYPKNILPEVAVVGRSNVGKSSLINYILHRKKLAKVSGTPGKTRQINYFIINNSFYLVDLPGYGYAQAPLSEQAKWRKFIEEYFIENPNIKLLLQLIDIRHEFKNSDKVMIDFLKANNIPYVIILTKSDKLNTTELNKQKKYFSQIFSDTELVVTSSEKGSGKEGIFKTIGEYLAKSKAKPSSPVLREDHDSEVQDDDDFFT